MTRTFSLDFAYFYKAYCYISNVLYLQFLDLWDVFMWISVWLKWLKMSDKLVTWGFALQLSVNFTVLWNKIKKIVHMCMFRTLLSTNWWKLYVKYLNFKFLNLMEIYLTLDCWTELSYNLQTLYYLDWIITHNLTCLGIVIKVVRNQNLLKLYKHCLQQKMEMKNKRRKLLQSLILKFQWITVQIWPLNWQISSDLETVVTSIVTKLFDSFKKEINERFSEKAIENLIKENEELKKQIARQRKQISEIQKQVADNEIISKQALQMSSYNQQYSRKFNIKIMNYPEMKDEKIWDLFVKDIVKDKLKIKVDPSEIYAIHRIPGKIGEARPVLVKLVISEVKYRIMRAERNLPKKETVRLVDDVTKHNMGLNTRLSICKELESS